MNSKRKISITTLIGAGFATVLLLVCAMAWQYANSIRRLHTIAEDLYVHPFLVSNSAIELKANIFQLRSETLAYAFLAQSADNAELLLEQSAGLDQQIFSNLAIIKRNFLGEKAQVLLLESKLNEWAGIRERIISAANQGDIETIKLIVKNEGAPKFYEISQIIEYVINFAQNRARQFMEEAQQHSSLVMKQVYFFTIIIMVFVLLSSILVLWRVNFLQAILERQAKYDFLTGVPNRRHFMELAEYELSKNQRYKQDVVLAIADLDLFKSVNDLFGHEAGDLALKAFCKACKISLRETDTLARIGGEEFAILLPNTDIEEGKEVLERVRSSIERNIVELPNRKTFQITASFGLTSATPKSKNLDQLIHEADAALYQAKNAGRNRLCLAQ